MSILSVKPELILYTPGGVFLRFFAIADSIAKKHRQGEEVAVK